MSGAGTSLGKPADRGHDRWSMEAESRSGGRARDEANPEPMIVMGVEGGNEDAR